MAIKSGSRVKFNIGKQVGDATAISSAMQQLSCVRVGESLNSTSSEYVSEAITPIRDIADARNGILTVAGSLPIEVQVSSFDIFAEGILGHFEEEEDDIGNTLTRTYTRADTVPQYTLEKVFDAGTVLRYAGLKMNQMSLTFDPDALITASIDFMGKTSKMETSQINPVATLISGKLFAGIDVIEIKVGGVKSEMISATLNINNGAEGVNAMGHQFVYDNIEGRGEVTLDTELFFESTNDYQKFVNEEVFEVSLKMVRGTDSIEFILPKAKFTGNRDPVVATDKGLTVSYTARGLLDVASNGAIKIITVKPLV